MLGKVNYRLPNWIGKYILQGAYPCTFTNGMDLNTCSAVKARYEGTGNLVYDMDFEIILDAKCFNVNDENAEKYGDAALSENLITCDNASGGYIMKKMQNTGSYVEFTGIEMSEGDSYSLDYRYFAQSTQTDKTVTIHINGVPFVENAILNPGNGWCYETGSQVAIQTFENLPLLANTSNTIRIINDVSYEGICVKTTSNLSSHTDKLKTVKIYPTSVNRSNQNFIYAELPGKDNTDCSVEVLDYSGRLVSKYNFKGCQKMKIPVNNLSKGLHVVKVKRKTSVNSFKILIE